MLPFGGKFLTKTTTASPLYIMNSVSSGVQAITKSTSSTPVIMTCKPQEPITTDPDLKKADDDKFENTNNLNHSINDNDNTKSSVLADILKASEFATSDNVQNEIDIEAHLSRYTISQERVVNEHVTVDASYEVIDNSEMVENPQGCDNNQNDTYISDNKNEISEILSNSAIDDVMIDNLDTETGECTVETTITHCDDEIEQYITSDSMVAMQKSTDIDTMN